MIVSSLDSTLCILLLIAGLAVLIGTGIYCYKVLWNMFDEMIQLKKDLREENIRKERIYRNIKKSLEEKWENENNP